ncbi:hypothetical protein Q7P37_006966 [Cladosporium fusiforme]
MSSSYSSSGHTNLSPPPPETRRSPSSGAGATSVSTQIALRNMRRLEARRNMEENHYLSQKARNSNHNSPVDLRALDYVSKYDDNLVCPICRCPLVDPVLLMDCDHCFCRECIRQTWTTYSPLGPKGDCPTCRMPAKLGARSSTSKILVNILDDLVVKCPKHENGCKAEIKRGEVQDHIAIYCSYAMVECKDSNCGQSVRRKDYESGCLHYNVSCESCQQSMPKAELETHWQLQCPDRQIQCDLCSSTIYHRDREEHRKTACPAASVPCPGASLGCTNKSKRAHVEIHARGCALAKLAPVLEAQKQRMDEQESATKTITRKLEILETGFTAMQDIISTRPSSIPNNASTETLIVPSRNRAESSATVSTSAASADDYDFPIPPSIRGSTTVEPANGQSSPPPNTTGHENHPFPSRPAPSAPGPRPANLPPSTSVDFDLASPFPSTDATSNDPYASPLHHLLSMHENLREEMTRISSALQELDGRHSMQILNENLRMRDEIAYLGGQVAGVNRQVHWLTSSQLQRQQGGGGGGGAGGAGSPSNSSAPPVAHPPPPPRSASLATASARDMGGADAPATATRGGPAGVEVAVNAMSTAATALRGAARVVNVGGQAQGPTSPGAMRRGTSEEGRTKL